MEREKKKVSFMRMLWWSIKGVFGRDWIDTAMVTLMVLFGIAYLVTGDNYSGFLFLVALWGIRMMHWQYVTWDRIDKYVTDNKIRMEQFGLAPYDSEYHYVKKPRSVIGIITSAGFVLAVILMFVLLGVSIFG